MTAVLLPQGKQQYFTSAGIPLNGGKVYTYDTGASTTPRMTWQDAAQAAPNTNPVILDARGEASIFWSGAYRVVLKDSLDNTIWTQDGVSDPTATLLVDLANFADGSKGAGLVGFGPSVSYAANTVGKFLNQVYGRTALEIAAGVTPTNYYYLPGVILRYANAVGDGSHDDTQAIVDALATGHFVRGYGPEYTYKATSTITVTRATEIDWEGATFLLSGNTRGFNTIFNPDVTTTMTAAVAIGARSFLVTSAAGLVVGDWCYFQVNLNTEESYNFPPQYAQITNIGGLTITVDRAFQVAIPAGLTDATVGFYHDASWKSYFKMRNGIMDGSANTYNGGALGTLARILGFRKTQFENIDLINWNSTANPNNQVFTIFRCLDTSCINIGSRNCIGNSQIFEVVDCASSLITNCIMTCDSFGPAQTRCDNAVMCDNEVTGFFTQNVALAIAPPRSVRGLKQYGCWYGLMSNNKVNDFTTGIRGQGCSRMVVMGNTVVNCSWSGTSTDVSLAVDNQINGTNEQSVHVIGNVVENSGGIAIAVDNSTSFGKHIIANNTVRGCQSVAINAVCANSNISGNQIHDWGLRNAADEGVKHNRGCIMLGNTFSHATLAALPCIQATLNVGTKYCFRDNLSINANPLFTGGLNIISNGASTIASGSTSSTPTHLMIRTPTSTEIFTTMTNKPTNNPQSMYITAITATQFTMNANSDPGASGLIVGWRVELIQPFTA